MLTIVFFYGVPPIARENKRNNLKLDLSRLCYKDSLSSIVLPVSSDVYDMRDRVRDAALHLQPILKQIEKQIR